MKTRKCLFGLSLLASCLFIAGSLKGQSDEEKYLRLSAELIKSSLDAPAADQERVIPQLIDKFRRQYPQGFIYLRVSLQQWTTNPSAYFARYPDIFVEKVEDTSVSEMPNTITENTIFIGEPVFFKNDSEWKVIEAVSLGKNLPIILPLVKGQTTEGRYVFVVYTVKNLTGQSEAIMSSPKLSDGAGGKYEALPNESNWVHFAGVPAITMEQLPNRVTKKFAAIYEMPAGKGVYYFDAREIGTSHPAIIPITLAARPTQ